MYLQILNVNQEGGVSFYFFYNRIPAWKLRRQQDYGTYKTIIQYLFST